MRQYIVYIPFKIQAVRTGFVYPLMSVSLLFLEPWFCLRI